LALLVFVAESALCESSCWHCWCLKQSLRSVRALFGTVGVCSGVCTLLVFVAESALCESSCWQCWCLKRSLRSVRALFGTVGVCRRQEAA